MSFAQRIDRNFAYFVPANAVAALFARLRRSGIVTM